MVSISEKIAHTSLHQIKLHKQGLFWVAYEQSAYYIWQLKGFKPTKKFVKSVAVEVVQIGFTTLEGLLNGSTLKIVIKEEKFICLETSVPIDLIEFTKWKEALPVFEAKSSRKQALPNQRLVDSIRQFDVFSQTPIAAMLFIVELKKMLHNGNL